MGYLKQRYIKIGNYTMVTTYYNQKSHPNLDGFFQFINLSETLVTTKIK